MQALLSISRFLRFSFSVILACLLIFGGCLLKPGGLDASGDGGFSPINPAYLAFMQSGEVSTMEALSSGSTETKGLGYTPSPLNLSDLSGTPVSPEGPLALAATFEPVFDLREQNRVSPVKDQGNDNTCWAFAAMGSSEAGLLRFVVTPNPSAWNFSEWHLGYLAYKDATARSFTLGTGDVFMKGGNDWKSIALLSRWTGIVSESVCPYGGSLPSGNEPQIRHLQDAYYLPIQSGVGFSAENVKTALKNFGPVSVAFYWNSTYYNSSSGAYFYTGNSSPNHAVVIVGWDDNYSSSNFKTPPSGNGAWIVKNSWGTDWGKNGYFYLSYFDSSLEGGVAYRADAGTNYARVYDYDPLGWIGSWGSYSPSGTYTPSTTAWMANIFTAVASEPLRAVSFYAGSPDTAYEIRIYRGVSTGAPRSGQIASSQPESGTLDIPGYRTVVLGTPASLQAGERFSVVVKLTTPASYRPIPVEYRVAGYSDNAAASTNQSFVSLDGTAWQDAASLSNPSNVCLKAFTGTGTSSGTPETPTETTPTTPSTPSDSGGGGGGGCNLGLFPSFGLALLVPLLALIRRKR